MTMVSFITARDHAEVVTDSIHYDTSGLSVGYCTKTLPLPHMDAVLISQGDATFSRWAQMYLSEVSERVASVDQLAVATTSGLDELWWERVGEGGQDEPTTTTIFALGWSPDEQRFVAWALDSDADFRPARIDEFFLIPAPFDVRPSRLEVNRFRRFYEGRHEDFLTRWLEASPAPAPTSRGQWRAVAHAARERAIGHPFARHPVGGRVHHTRLERGSIHTTLLDTFTDDDKALARMFNGGFHPAAQAAPCLCESGRRAIDCCLVPHLDKPCPCRSGRPLRACCSIDAA